MCNTVFFFFLILLLIKFRFCFLNAAFNFWRRKMSLYDSKPTSYGKRMENNSMKLLLLIWMPPPGVTEVSKWQIAAMVPNWARKDIFRCTDMYSATHCMSDWIAMCKYIILQLSIHLAQKLQSLFKAHIGWSICFCDDSRKAKTRCGFWSGWNHKMSL